MLVPGVLSDSAPHFLRTIGLLPALFALPAVGLVTGADWLRSRLARSARPARAALVPIVGVVAIVGVSQALTWWDYFVRLPREPGLAETFDAPRAALARVAGDPPPGLDLSLPTPGWSYATIRFLRHHDFGTPRPAYSTEFRFDRQVVLLGYDLEPDPLPAERTGRLTLYWRALREMNASYVRGARLVDQYNRVWWEAAGEPGFGTLPTDTWEPGEVVADHMQVDLTPGTPAGRYQLELSLAQPGGGRKLTIFDPAGRSIGSALRLPDVRVGGRSGG
jgi:hypothetical protein